MYNIHLQKWPLTRLQSKFKREEKEKDWYLIICNGASHRLDKQSLQDAPASLQVLHYFFHISRIKEQRERTEGQILHQWAERNQRHGVWRHTSGKILQEKQHRRFRIFEISAEGTSVSVRNIFEQYNSYQLMPLLRHLFWSTRHFFCWYSFWISMNFSLHFRLWLLV